MKSAVASKKATDVAVPDLSSLLEEEAGAGLDCLPPRHRRVQTPPKFNVQAGHSFIYFGYARNVLRLPKETCTECSEVR